MNIKIYTETPTKRYYESLFYLEKQSKLKVNLIDSRWIYSLLIKLNNNCFLFKFLRKLLTGKYNFIKNELSFKYILKSFFAPLRLLFTKDVIVTLFPPYSFMIYYLILLKLFRKKIIYMTSWPYWSNKRYPKGSIINKFLWKKFIKNTLTVAITKKATKETRKHGAISFYIPHCIDTTLFKPKLKKNKKLKLLYVGRLIKEKGLIELLDVISKIKSKNFEFDFVGSGPLANFIKLKEKELPIRLLGQINDKKKLINLYQNSDIFILNSYAVKKWEELFGISLLEAMACGKAIISTNCIGPKELIKDKFNGILIGQHDKMTLLKNINSLIKNKKLRSKLSKNARKTALNYEVKDLSKKWFNLIRYFS